MSQMADGEGTADGYRLTPSTNEEHVDGLSSLTKSLAKAGPEPTNIDAMLASLPVSKQSQPPMIPPKLSDSLVKEKGGEQELQGTPPNLRLLEDGLKGIHPELIRLRVSHLQRREGFQHQYKHLSSEYMRKAEGFVGRLEKFRLDEILSTETDLVFLQQLLDHIYSLEME